MNDAEEFDLNSIDWDVQLPRSNFSFRLRDACRWLLPCRTVSRCLQDAEHPTCPLMLAVDRDWLTKSDLPTSFRVTA